MLTEVDNHSHESATYQDGPFSVFAVPIGESSNSSTEEPSPTTRHGPTSSPALTALQAEEEHRGDDPLSTNIASNASTPQIDENDISQVGHTGRPSDAASSALSPSPAEPASGQAATVPPAAEQSPDTSSQPATPPTYQGDQTTLPQTMSAYAMPMPQLELVHHWVTFLSKQLLLVDSPDNPCRNIFVPMALKGAAAEPGDSSMYCSIFHAICSASAFSLHNLRNEKQYQSLALGHEQCALGHLRQNLHWHADVNEATIAAVISCITAEAISGRRRRWRTHLAAPLALVEREADADWIRSSTASYLLQSYLSLSSLCNLPISKSLLALFDDLPGQDHYLERAHGLTVPLISFLARLTNIIESKESLATHQLDELEFQLYLSYPSLPTTEEDCMQLIQHAVDAFYYATLIYFRRTIRRVPSESVQDLVEKALNNLEAVESLTQGKGGTAYNWPSLVVSAECGNQHLQRRMLTWLDGKRRHGLQSIGVIRELALLLWQRRAAAKSGEDFHWQDIACEEDFDIMFV